MMCTLQKKSIAAQIVILTLTVCSTVRAYDASLSNFKWLSPQTLTPATNEIKFWYAFNMNPSYFKSCNYDTHLYLSDDQTLSSDDYLLYQGSIYVPAYALRMTNVTTKKYNNGLSSLPDTGTYYVFFEISPRSGAPADTDIYNNAAMSPVPVWVIVGTPENPVPLEAIEPYPKDKAVEQPITADISWADGVYATNYNVYFGTDPTPDETEFIANQSGTIYDPGILKYNTTYYWRIDAKNNNGTTTGEVWSFTTTKPDFGKIIYVDSDAPGSNDGTSWVNAYNYLQDALAEANSADEHIEIRVAQGIYTPDRSSIKPNGTGDRAASFQLIDSVSLKGGYGGVSEPDPNVRDAAVYETILSGDLDGNDSDVSNPRSLLNESTRKENSYHVVTAGGTHETAVLDSFMITGGNANDSQLNLEQGAGMYNDSGSPTLINCTFQKNSAERGGGGIYNNGGSPVLANCTFNRNFAWTEGGGICNTFADPILSSCIFSRNSTKYDGAGMSNNFSNPILSNCIFSRNSADDDAGGIQNAWSSPSLYNCTFVDNRAVKDGNALVLKSIVSQDPSDIQIINCIFWDGGDEISLESNNLVSVTYSDVQGGFAGEGNIDVDPWFVDPIKDDYRLNDDSPCIGAGIMAPGVPNTDIEGNPRPNPPGSKPDMGAHENGPQ